MEWDFNAVAWLSMAAMSQLVVVDLQEPAMSNLFEGVPESVPEELIQELVTGRHVRVERIVSTGHRSPEGDWYDQEEREWVVLLKGRAELRFDDEAELRVMLPGDFVDIAPHRRHRVESTSRDEPTVWLAVFMR